MPHIADASKVPEDVWRLIALCLRDDFDSRQVPRDKQERCHGVEITPIHTARALLSLSSASKTTCSASRGLIFRRVVLAEDDWDHSLELRHASLAREHIKELLVRVSLDLGNEYLALLLSLRNLTHLSLHLLPGSSGSMESLVCRATKELPALTHLSIDTSCDSMFLADLERMPLTFSGNVRNLRINLHDEARTPWLSCGGIMGVSELSLSPAAVLELAAAHELSPACSSSVNLLRIAVKHPWTPISMGTEGQACACDRKPTRDTGEALVAFASLAPALGAELSTLLLHDIEVDTRQLDRAFGSIPKLTRLDIHPSKWTGYEESRSWRPGDSLDPCYGESDFAALGESDHDGAVDFVRRVLPRLLSLTTLHIGRKIVLSKPRRLEFEKIMKAKGGQSLKMAAIGLCSGEAHNVILRTGGNAGCRPGDDCFEWTVSELGSMTLELREGPEKCDDM